MPDREQWALGPSRALLPPCLNTEPARLVHCTSCSINTRKTAGAFPENIRGKGSEVMGVKGGGMTLAERNLIDRTPALVALYVGPDRREMLTQTK